LTMDQKILEGPVDVQFSNRGEWDLGPSPGWQSYAHFYHQEMYTCMDADYTEAKTIMREFRYLSTSWSGSELNLLEVGQVQPIEPWGLPVVWRSEFVLINNVWAKAGLDYTIDYETGYITFTPALTSDKVEVYFKMYKHDTMVDGELTKLDDSVMTTPHLYDVAQIISKDETVVGFQAFWPVLSDYTVDGWDRAITPLVWASEADMTPTGSEPDIPYVIANGTSC